MKIPWSTKRWSCEVWGNCQWVHIAKSLTQFFKDDRFQFFRRTCRHSDIVHCLMRCPEEKPFFLTLNTSGLCASSDRSAHLQQSCFGRICSCSSCSQLCNQAAQAAVATGWVQSKSKSSNLFTWPSLRCQHQAFVEIDVVDRLGTFSCDLDWHWKTGRKTEKRQRKDIALYRFFTPSKCCKAAVEGLLLRIWRTMLGEMSNRSLNLFEVNGFVWK